MQGPEEGEEERNTSGAGTAFFPLEVFYNGGSLFHDLVDCSNLSGTMPTVPVMSPEVTSRLSTCIATDGGGGGAVKENRQCTWAERLFREEDMRPHRNFALCRREFRVCVASQLPMELVQECLFGGRCPTDDGSEDRKLTSADSQSEMSAAISDGSCYPVCQNSRSNDALTRAEGVSPAMIPVGYSGVLPPMEHFQLIYVNKDDDDPSA